MKTILPTAITLSLVAAGVFGLSPAANAGLIGTLDEDDRGWYRDNGNHTSTNTNYAVGGVGSAEYRNFFVFDLSGVTETISSAVLHLQMPVNGHISSEPTETYRVQAVTTSIASLTAGTGGVAAFSDLGTGTAFGSQTVQDSDEGSFVDITLNAAALAALNSASGQWAVGGNLTTLNPFNDNEYTFGFTSGTQTTQLILHSPVPEPTTVLPLLCLVTFAVVLYRPRRRCNHSAFTTSSL